MARAAAAKAAMAPTEHKLPQARRDKAPAAAAAAVRPVPAVLEQAVLAQAQGVQAERVAQARRPAAAWAQEREPGSARAQARVLAQAPVQVSEPAAVAVSARAGPVALRVRRVAARPADNPDAPHRARRKAPAHRAPAADRLAAVNRAAELRLPADKRQAAMLRAADRHQAAAA